MFNQMQVKTNSEGDLPVSCLDGSLATSATEESKENDEPSKSSKPEMGKLHKPGRKSSSKPKKFKSSSPVRSRSETSSLSSISMGYNESDLTGTTSSDSSSNSSDSFAHRCCRRRSHRRARREKQSNFHRRRSAHSKSSKSSLRRRALPLTVSAPEEGIEGDNSDSEEDARPSRKKRNNRYKDVAIQTSPQKKSIHKSKPAVARTSSSSRSGSVAKTASHASKAEGSSSSSKVDDKSDSTGSNSKPKSSSSSSKPISDAPGGKPKDPGLAAKVTKDSTKTIDEEVKHSVTNSSLDIKPTDSGSNLKLSIVDFKPIDTGSNTKCQTNNSKVDVNPTTLPKASNSSVNFKPGEAAAISPIPLASITSTTGSNQLPAKSDLMQRSIRTRSRSCSRSRSRSRSRGHSKSRSPIRNRYGRMTSPNSTSFGRERGSFRSGAPPISKVRLHIKGLSRQVTKEHVTEIFGNFGPLTAVDFPIELYGDHTGRGFAFVEFANPTDCARAIKNMDGGQIDSRRIVVSAFRPNKVRATWRRRYSPVHGSGGSRTHSRSRSRNRSSSDSRSRYRSRSSHRYGQYRGPKPRGYQY